MAKHEVSLVSERYDPLRSETIYHYKVGERVVKLLVTDQTLGKPDAEIPDNTVKQCLHRFLQIHGDAGTLEDAMEVDRARMSLMLAEVMSLGNKNA
jgi:hypothetical protein